MALHSKSQWTIKDFKNAKDKEGVLDKHATYLYHKDAMLKGKSFLARYDNPVLRVDNMLDAESQGVAMLNKLALKSIVECIIYCGKQGISFSGHRDDATCTCTANTSNKGNYFSIQFRVQTDAVLHNFIERDTNSHIKDNSESTDRYLWRLQYRENKWTSTHYFP